MSVCPSSDHLLALLNEQLPEEAQAELEVHLSSCPACQDQLARLTTSAEDAQVHAYLRAGTPPAWGAAPVSPAIEPPVTFLNALKQQLRQESLPWVMGRAPRPAEPPRPVQVGPYTVLGQLGQGGMGVVYQGYDERLRRPVAIKMIRGRPAGEHLQKRIRREAEAVARLQHPNIVQIYEVGEHNGWPYLVLEFMADGSLAERARGEPQPPRLAAQLLLPLAGAIHHAHRHGIVHRDLKPANVLLRRRIETPPAQSETVKGTAKAGGLQLTDFELKVSDFGLAKQLGDVSALSQSGEAIGTPSYMAPEQASGQNSQVGAPADVYALGALLYELLTGRPPFRCILALDTLNQVVSDPPVPPSTLVAMLPRDLETICLKCLEKAPARRYASAQALAEDLQRFLDGRPIAARPVGRVERGARWCRRHPTGAALVALLLAVAVAGPAAAYHQMQLRQEADANADLARQQQAKAAHYFTRARQAVHDTLTKVANDPRLKQADFHDLRRDLLQTTLPFHEEFVQEQTDDPDLRAEQAAAHGDLARLRFEMGDLVAAKRDAGLAREAFDRLAAADPANSKYRDGQAYCLNTSGMVARAAGESAEALTYFRQAGQAWEKLAADYPGSLGPRLELGVALEGQTQVLQESGRLAEAEEHCRRALKVQERLAANHPTVPACQLQLVNGLVNLASTLSRQGRFTEAEPHSRQAVERLQELATKYPSYLDFRTNLGTARINYGILLAELSRWADAEAQEEEAIAVCEKLAADFPAVPQPRHQCGLALSSLGQMLEKQGRFEEAEKYHLRGLDIQERLTKDFPAQVEYLLALARTHMRLGYTCNGLRRRKEAEQWFDRSRQGWEQLQAVQPKEPSYREANATMANELAAMAASTGRPGKALTLYRSALGVSEKLVAEFPNRADYAVQLGGICCNLGHLDSAIGKLDEAMTWYDRAAATLRPIVAAQPQLPQSRPFLFNTVRGRINVLGRLGRHAESLPDWDCLIELADEKRPVFRAIRVITLVHAGERARAIAEIDELSNTEDLPGDAAYELARACCVGAAVARDRRDELLARAVRLLERVQALGLFKDPGRVGDFKQSADFAPVRQSAEGRKLLDRLAPPNDPKAPQAH